MRVLLVGNSYLLSFKGILQANCPAARVDEVKDGDEEILQALPQESPDVIVLSNRTLRLANQIRQTYPEAVLVALLLEDEVEYRKVADKGGVDHLLVPSTMTIEGIRQVICPYA